MDYMVSDLRLIGLSAKPFQNRDFERENQNIILCWKYFTNNIYWIKNNQPTIMDYIVSAFG
jgi:hypothetical protein